MPISRTETRRGNGPGGPKGARGFTLLELMVVLAIAALIVSISLPNLRLPGFASDAAKAARQIASGLAEARQAAIFTNTEIRLTLDLVAFNAGLVIIGQDREALPADRGTRCAVECPRHHPILP